MLNYEEKRIKILEELIRSNIKEYGLCRISKNNIYKELNALISLREVRIKDKIAKKCISNIKDLEVIKTNFGWLIKKKNDSK